MTRGRSVVFCVVSTVDADQVAPVFFWPTPQRADLVLTKEQYELALTAQQAGPIAASAAIILALTALLLSLRARNVSRDRSPIGQPDREHRSRRPPKPG